LHAVIIPPTNQPTNQKTSRLTKLYKMMKPCPNFIERKHPRKGERETYPKTLKPFLQKDTPNVHFYWAFFVYGPKYFSNFKVEVLPVCHTFL